MQNLVDVERRKGVCVKKAFFVTFCVLFIFFCILSQVYRRPITNVYDLKRVLSRKVIVFGGFYDKK